MKSRKYRAKIEGRCPNCQSDTLAFIDQAVYWGGRLIYKALVPMCVTCKEDEIEVRKINNRRYRVLEL